MVDRRIRREFLGKAEKKKKAGKNFEHNKLPAMEGWTSSCYIE